jgi:hypothetical protein
MKLDREQSKRVRHAYKAAWEEAPKDQDDVADIDDVMARLARIMPEARTFDPDAVADVIFRNWLRELRGMRTKQANARRLRIIAEDRGDTELVELIDQAFFNGVIEGADAMVERYEHALRLAARASLPG